MHPALRVAFGHLLVDDPASRRHPLDITGIYGPSVTDTVSMLDLACEDVRDGLDPAMRMPRETGKIFLGDVVTEIVEQQEWIKISRIAEAEGSAEMHPGAFESWGGFNETLTGRIDITD